MEKWMKLIEEANEKKKEGKCDLGIGEIRVLNL